MKEIDIEARDGEGDNGDIENLDRNCYGHEQDSVGDGEDEDKKKHGMEIGMGLEIEKVTTRTEVEIESLMEIVMERMEKN